MATPSNRIQKEKVLVSPQDVTVISPVDSDDISVQVSSHPTVQSSLQSPAPSSQPVSFVTSEQFAAMNDKWAEQFAC